MVALVGQAVAVAGLILLLVGLEGQEHLGKALQVAHLQIVQIMVQEAAAVLPQSVQVL
jgi:hypothetical protein